MTNYRNLSDKEIATLTVYGCSADNWTDVKVSEAFSPTYISNVHFSGNVFLGTYNSVFYLAGGVKKHAGIYNCQLHNCIVGNDVFIDKIHNYIANYSIGDGSYIENVNVILTEGESTFGNGVSVPVMIEAGGRELRIFNHLSAQLAYILTFYRYNIDAIDALNKEIDLYCISQKSDKGSIGNNVRIVNCKSIKNVRIGNFAQVEGASCLENGSIISNQQSPVNIGSDVQCTNFIINAGTTVSEAALISNCFIGEACLISKQFSALDSLFFANCQGLHGEAVSIFAGPYTITHHKSTLMLTALYSFMNAGSGTNFSNHMYKLGPVHQGITERGVKTSSDSYIMWPAKIGAFTVVLGRHKGNPDISDLPFSYLIESDGESHLLPGINLHSAGTLRDIQKWPKRDNRLGENKLDLINFDFLSPYTLSNVLKGIEILTGMIQNMDQTNTFVWYQNCKIKRSSLKKGIELYEMAINQFVGEKVIERINGQGINDITSLTKSLSTSSTILDDNWVDMAGLIAPKMEVEKLLYRILKKEITLQIFSTELVILHNNYSQFSWNWAKNILEKKYGDNLYDTESLITIVENWKNSTLTFNDLILRDAKKEFNSISKIGFGLDGNETEKQLDFELVRGNYSNNLFVKEILSNNDATTKLATNLITKLTELKNEEK